MIISMQSQMQVQMQVLLILLEQQAGCMVITVWNIGWWLALKPQEIDTQVVCSQKK